MEKSSDTALYKYMPYKFFSKMLEESALTLVDPFQCWEDTYEGAFYRAIKDEETFNYLVSITRHKTESESVIASFRRLLLTVSSVKAQSWTKNRDDLLMWAAYSNNKRSIMVQTSIDKLNTVCKDNYPASIDALSLPWIHDVVYDYDRESSIQSDIIRAFDAIALSMNPYEPFLHKRTELSFEQEVRLLAADSNQSNRKTAKLRINDIKAFIDGVMVHPGATKQFAGKVCNECEKYGITYLGKSQKYDVSFLTV